MRLHFEYPSEAEVQKRVLLQEWIIIEVLVRNDPDFSDPLELFREPVWKHSVEHYFIDQKSFYDFLF